MGALTSRQNAGVEEVDIGANHAYRYPPRNGNYFGSHFIMGGEKFDTPQPEAYLFGENADLNFLGNRPTPFPYTAPQANEPTKTLKSLVNIRKESLRFVRIADDSKPSVKTGVEEERSSKFNIEFTFDCDCRCSITIYYFCTEEVTSRGVVYLPRDAVMNSETYYYKRGANQQFSQASHVFDPSLYSEEDLTYCSEHEAVPVAIHCVAEEGPEDPKQSHTTIGVVERHSDGTYVLKALKQKLFVDGLCYLLQEIYGIENKNADNIKTAADDDTEDNGSECVICMCDMRDTLILPCRHLCLCNSCADSLRYQANNCPICRAPFRALLQIRAVQKSTGLPTGLAPLPESCSENVPAGYEAVSLIEALNGPYQPTTVNLPPVLPGDVVGTPDSECPPRPVETVSRSTNERSGNMPPAVGSIEEPDDVDESAKEEFAIGTCPTPEIRMSLLLAREEEGTKEEKSALTHHGTVTRHATPLMRDKSVLIPRDTVKVVNELDHLNRDEPEVELQDVEIPAEEPRELEQPQSHDAATSTESGLTPVVTPTPTPVATPTSVGPVKSVKLLVEKIGDGDAKLCEVSVKNSEETIAEVEEEEDGEEIKNGFGATAHAAVEMTSLPGDDSDYYTPEDPSTTILSPLQPSRETTTSAESTPSRLLMKGVSTQASGLGSEAISLPGTPLSHASHLSHRSSGESFSSSGSTRQLLPHTENEGRPTGTKMEMTVIKQL